MRKKNPEPRRAAHGSADASDAVPARQRLDKWLWHARMVRTRSEAAKLVAAGHVRINSARVDAAGYSVRAGDVITLALDHAIKVVRVVAFCERRGPAEAGRALYERVN